MKTKHRAVKKRNTSVNCYISQAIILNACAQIKVNKVRLDPNSGCYYLTTYFIFIFSVSYPPTTASTGIYSTDSHWGENGINGNYAYGGSDSTRSIYAPDKSE